MALRTVVLPECDVCGEMWLPDKKLPDGTINPARKNPELCYRCGKCKTPRWNWKIRDAKKEAGKAQHKSSVGAMPKKGVKIQHQNDQRIKKHRLCKHRLLNCPSCQGE